MKTAGRENPNSRARLCTEPSTWSGRPEPFSLIHTGWKVRKYPAVGEVFFLTFPFIEQPCPAVHRTEHMERKARTILAHSHGLESQKISGGGRSVFLDFSFYRTAVPGCAPNRAHGAEGQNHSRSFTRAGKSENIRRWEKC